MITIVREITPLTESDCFTFFSRVKSKFDFPLHTHEEFEINFIQNAKGAKRIVGDHIEEINELELVLVGSNLPHAWFTHNCKSEQITEVTLQFHSDLFDSKFLQRNQLSFIRTMLEKSAKGILFSEETALALRSRFLELHKKSSFDSVLELMSILHDLSISRNMRILSKNTFTKENPSFNSRRIEKAFNYMQKNFDKNITLDEMSKLVGMTPVSFSRFIKKSTGKTFVDSLNEIRIGRASRLLIDTSHTIAEISFQSGFNNLSYFNRIFKATNQCTPKEFRENYSGTKTFI